MFALPPSSFLRLWFGQSWPGVTAPPAPARSMAAGHGAGRASPSPATQRARTNSSYPPLSPGTRNLENRAPQRANTHQQWRAAASSLFRPSAPLYPFPISNLSRQSKDQRPETTHTPSVFVLLKSPPILAKSRLQSPSRMKSRIFFITR